MEIDDPALVRAAGILSIDLDAIRENYGRLLRQLNGVPCAAVVKADAYGLGAARVGPGLAEAGVECFFVAQFEEAITLRAALGQARHKVRIYVLNGLATAPPALFFINNIRPVLNSLGEVTEWTEEAGRRQRRLAAALHIDTGMSRLGLPEDELARLADDLSLLDGIELDMIMSHLACADTPDHSLNQEQLEAFRNALARLPSAPACFANSSGIFLGPDYHFDLARPGAALFGINPAPGRPNPLQRVVTLQARILQIREIDAPRSVGYGAAFRAGGPTRIATVAAGYADGYLRSASNRGAARLGGHSVPLVGRVSMDLVTFDVSAVPPDLARPGALMELIGPENDQDALAEAAGTIGYEILTSLGRRYRRRYLCG